MGTVKSLNKWANRNTFWPIDILRVALGVFLIMKGIQFSENSQVLIDLFKPLQNIAGGMITLHYVPSAHFVGGILIVFGLLTRWVILAILPILIGAVLINFAGEMNTANLTQELITLVVCLFFLAYGSGKRSADYFFKMQK